MADIKALLADPEFKTLSLEGQKKALARLDPELGGLSDTGYLKFVYQVAPPVGTEKLSGGLSSPLGPSLDPLKPPVLPRSGSPFVRDLNQEPVRHTPPIFRTYPGRAGSETPFPDPVQDWIGEGMRKMGEGAVQVGSPGQEGTTPANQIMGGTSKVFRGGMQTAAPFVLPGAIATAPAAVALGIPTAAALGGGTEAGLNAMGVSPEKSAFGGDVGSIVGGVLGGAMSKPVSSVIDAVRAGWDNPAIRQAGIYEIPYFGPKIVRFIKALEPPPPKVYPAPGVRPQGQGLPGFPKPPGPPEPKVYPAPAVTPQGRGLSGFPKPPGPPEPWAAPRLTQQGQGGLVGFPKPPGAPELKQWPVPRVTFKTPMPEKPFNPGLPPPPRFKTEAPTEKPFNPPVPKLTYPGWTARGAGGGGKALAGELTEAQVNAEIAKWKAQQPEPRQPVNPRTSTLETSASERIRPEETNPAAEPSGGRLYSETKHAHQEVNSQIHAEGRKMDLPGSPPGKNISVDQLAQEVYGKPLWSDLTLDEKSALNEHLQSTKSWPTRQAMGLPPL